MEKTFLEQKIQQQAKKRFSNDLKQLVAFIQSHPIGKYLEIRSGEEKAYLASDDSYSIFRSTGSWASANDKAQRFTNYSEVEARVLAEYVEAETENVLNKLEHISYLFNEQS